MGELTCRPLGQRLFCDIGIRSISSASRMPGTTRPGSTTTWASVTEQLLLVLRIISAGTRLKRLNPGLRWCFGSCSVSHTGGMASLAALPRISNLPTSRQGRYGMLVATTWRNRLGETLTYSGGSWVLSPKLSRCGHLSGVSGTGLPPDGRHPDCQMGWMLHVVAQCRRPQQTPAYQATVSR